MGKLHSKRVEKIAGLESTDVNVIRSIFGNADVLGPLQSQLFRLHLFFVSSFFSHLFHSFRVCFHIFSTRFEFVFTSCPLVSSVVLGVCAVALAMY
jgi:hypothetical protein